MINGYFGKKTQVNVVTALYVPKTLSQSKATSIGESQRLVPLGAMICITTPIIHSFACAKDKVNLGERHGIILSLSRSWLWVELQRWWDFLAWGFCWSFCLFV
jgi:hypothetical protein